MAGLGKNRPVGFNQGMIVADVLFGVSFRHTRFRGPCALVVKPVHFPRPVPVEREVPDL